jgi:hypothetical protein
MTVLLIVLHNTIINIIIPMSFLVLFLDSITILSLGVTPNDSIVIPWWLPLSSFFNNNNNNNNCWYLQYHYLLPLLQCLPLTYALSIVRPRSTYIHKHNCDWNGVGINLASHFNECIINHSSTSTYIYTSTNVSGVEWSEWSGVSGVEWEWRIVICLFFASLFYIPHNYCKHWFPTTVHLPSSSCAH